MKKLFTIGMRLSLNKRDRSGLMRLGLNRVGYPLGGQGADGTPRKKPYKYKYNK